MVRANLLVLLLSVVFNVQAGAVFVPDESSSLHVDDGSESFIEGGAVSINGVGNVALAGDGSHHIMRSERRHPDAGEANRFLKLSPSTEAEEEEEIIEQFRSHFDGDFISMGGMTTRQVSVRDDGAPGARHGADPGPLGDKANAIDGSAQNIYNFGSCTHTKKDKDPWWEVDLAAVHVISAVSISIRGDCCGWHCDQCPTMNLMIDWEACHLDAPFALGDSKLLSCPWVGDLLRVNINAEEDYLMLCEVTVKGQLQTALLLGLQQCDDHGFLVRALHADSQDATYGRCTADSQAVAVFQEFGVVDQTTSKECEEHLLGSHEMVEGADWQAVLKDDEKETASTTGSCRLLGGHRVTGAQHAVGARCFQKLRCPRDLAPFKARANTPKGKSWANSTNLFKQPKLTA